ncbi:hypothetical protein [Flavobacterium sp.]|uniref:hypothetical protein n=1 Tax=Flavobacterium sp. TaxID=239 RepID=UPI002636A735|nr:hypothetical protein [Flavobacterium sp.]
MKTILILIIFFCNYLPFINNGYCQNLINQNIGNYYDNIVSESSLPLYNGKFYNDIYKTKSDTIHPFLKKDFISGSVTYENQFYQNVNIKFDIYKDNLLINPKNKSNVFTLILDKSKVENFNFLNKTFINIDYKKYSNSKSFSGFFEYIPIQNNFELLVKYNKENEKVIFNEKLIDEFYYSQNFYIVVDNKIHKFNSKKDAIEIFKKNKSDINTFYRKNKYKEKNNPVMFKIELLNLLKSNSK